MSWRHGFPERRRLGSVRPRVVSWKREKRGRLFGPCNRVRLPFFSFLLSVRPVLLGCFLLGWFAPYWLLFLFALFPFISVVRVFHRLFLSIIAESFLVPFLFASFCVFFSFPFLRSPCLLLASYRMGSSLPFAFLVCFIYVFSPSPSLGFLNNVLFQVLSSFSAHLCMFQPLRTNVSAPSSSLFNSSLPLHTLNPFCLWLHFPSHLFCCSPTSLSLLPSFHVVYFRPPPSPPRSSLSALPSPLSGLLSRIRLLKLNLSHVRHPSRFH